MILLKESDTMDLSTKQILSLQEAMSDALVHGDASLKSITPLMMTDSRFGSLPDDIKNEPNVIKKMINVMIQSLNAKYKMRYRVVRRLSDEINAIYSDTQNLLKTNISKREAIATKRIPCSAYNIGIENNKKKYQFQYCNCLVNYDYLLTQASEAFEFATGTQRLNILKNLYDDAHKYLTNNFWYLEGSKYYTKPTDQIAPLESVISYTKDMIDRIYSNLFTGTTIVENELVYLGLFNKAYDEFHRRHDADGDKKAIDMVDTIFFECIKYIDKAINFNYQGYDTLMDAYRKLHEQMKNAYDFINKS